MNPNKSFTDLKIKQREKISEWLYEETNKYYKQYSRMPGKSQREAILFSVYDKIQSAEIWIPYQEVKKYYLSRLIHFEKRIIRSLG